MTKYLLTIVFLWLLVMLFYSPIPSDILEKEWEFPEEIDQSNNQKETKSKVHALRLNLSPSETTAQIKNPGVLLCCFPPKP